MVKPKLQQDPGTVKKPSQLTFLIFLILLILFPIFFGQLMVASLNKLHLGPGIAVPLVLAIVLGGVINIPLTRRGTTHEVKIHPLAVYGLPDSWPRMMRSARETVIAVNLGGCLIPTGIALYELVHLAGSNGHSLAAAGFATLVNTLVCFWIARPVPGLGIVMPGLVTPLVAAALALLLSPENAPAVAFVSGVLGPLIGADLLHLRAFTRSGAGMASIGGAGTFDGIVLSGIVAAYLA